jgi:hypothetical protein
MKRTMISVKWDDQRGEGAVVTTPYFDTAHIIDKLDCLQDCIHDLQKLYDSILSKDFT